MRSVPYKMATIIGRTVKFIANYNVFCKMQFCLFYSRGPHDLSHSKLCKSSFKEFCILNILLKEISKF